MEYFNWGSMPHPGRNMEDNDVDSDLKCRSLALEISENFHICDILVKNVAALCPCLKSQPGAKVKRFRSIPLIKKVSK